MNIALPYVVFAFALGSIAAARRGSTSLSTAAWLVTAGGFAYLQWGPASLGAAVSVSAVAGFVGLTLSGDSGPRRLRIAGFGAIAPAAVAIGAIVCVRDAAGLWGGSLVLFAASWAALIAAFSCVLAAGGINRRPLSSSIPLTITTAAFAIWVAGTGRSSLPDAFYGFPLQTGEDPLLWSLDPTPAFESGMRLAVAVPVPEMEAALIAVAVAGAVGLIASLLGRQKLVAGALTVAGLISAAALAGLSALVGSLSMPSGEPYSDEVKRRLLAAGGNRVTDTGAFTGSSDISVAMADLAPEIVGLAVVAGLTLVGVLALRRDEPTDDDERRATDRHVTRELLVRGVALLWTSWFVLLIVHNQLLGAPGMGSPGEWVFTGVCIVALGIVLMSSSPPQSKLGRALDELTPGMIAGALLFASGLAWRFGALPGLSLGIFE